MHFIIIDCGRMELTPLSHMDILQPAFFHWEGGVCSLGIKVENQAEIFSLTKQLAWLLIAIRLGILVHSLLTKEQQSLIFLDF